MLEMGLITDHGQFIFISSSDHDEDCEYLLANHQYEDQRGYRVATFRHHFREMQDFTDHLAKEVAVEVVEAGDDEPNLLKRCEIYKSYKAYLCEYRQAFSDVRGYCTVHKRYCPVVDCCLCEPPPSYGKRPRSATPVDQVSGDETEQESDNSRVSDSGHFSPIFGNMPYNLGNGEKLSDFGNVWSWWDASIPCVDFASFGAHEGLSSGRTAIPFYTIVGLIRAKRPRVVTREITSMKTAQLLQYELSDIYITMCVEANSDEMGKGMKRPRNLAVLIDHETTNWHGNMEEFLELTSYSMEQDGSTFFVFNEQRKAETQKMARDQKNYVTEDQALTLPFDDLCQVGGKFNFEQHIAKKLDLQGVNGTFLFDVQQNPGHCPGGPLLPCFVTHGTIVNGGVDPPRVLTSSEHMLAMGEPIQKRDYYGYTTLRCFIGEALENLSPSATKRIAGNAVDTVMQSAFAYYVACNISMKGSPQTIAPESPERQQPVNAPSSSSIGLPVVSEASVNETLERPILPIDTGVSMQERAVNMHKERAVRHFTDVPNTPPEDAQPLWEEYVDNAKEEDTDQQDPRHSRCRCLIPVVD